MNANPGNAQRPWWEIWGTALGGWATALALIAGIITFLYAYGAQERFNREQLHFNQQQLDKMHKGLELQKQAADEEHKAALAQRETAAVEALGRYLTNYSSDPVAWESAEAIIDLVGESPAWQATAKRALRNHPGTLKNIECELYSNAFVEFAAKSFDTTVDTLSTCKAQPKPLPRACVGKPL